MKTIDTKQQNRSKRTRTIRLDNQTQVIQNLLKRNAGRDHFEKTLFTSEQRLSSLSPSNIYGGANVTMDFARLPEDGSAHPLDMLNRSVRQRDPKFDVESPFLLNCFIETSLNK